MVKMSSNMIELLEGEIKDCKEIIEQNDKDAAEEKVNHLDTAYSKIPELQRITNPPVILFVSNQTPPNPILSGDPFGRFGVPRKSTQPKSIDWIERLKKCLGVLIVYVAELKDKQLAPNNKSNGAQEVSVNVNIDNKAVAKSSSSSSVQIENAIENINQLADNELSDNEKTDLINLLKKLETEDEKEPITSKILYYAKKGGENVARILIPVLAQYAPDLLMQLVGSF